MHIALAQPSRLTAKYIAEQFPHAPLEEQAAVVLAASKSGGVGATALTTYFQSPAGTATLNALANQAMATKNLALIDGLTKLVPAEMMSGAQYTVELPSAGVGQTPPLASLVYSAIAGSSPSLPYLLDVAINSGHVGTDSTAYVILKRVFLSGDKPNPSLVVKIISQLLQADEARAISFIQTGGQPLGDALGEAIVAKPSLFPKALKEKVLTALNINLPLIESRRRGYAPDTSTRDAMIDQEGHRVLTLPPGKPVDKAQTVAALLKRIVDNTFLSPLLDQNKLAKADALGEKLRQSYYVSSEDLIKLLQRASLMDPTFEQWFKKKQIWHREDLLNFALDQEQAASHSKAFQGKMKGFPYSIYYAKGNAVHSSLPSHNMFTVVMSYADVLPYLPLDKQTMDNFTSHIGHGTLGWARISPMVMWDKSKETSRSVWVLEELQSDVVDVGKPDVIHRYFRDWHLLLMNIVIKQAKARGVDEIWVPTAKNMGKKVNQTGEKSTQGFQHLYDHMANFYGAEAPSHTGIEFPMDMDAQNYKKIVTDEFYVINVKTLPPEKIASRGEIFIKEGRVIMNKHYAYHLTPEAPLDQWIGDAAVFIKTFITYMKNSYAQEGATFELQAGDQQLHQEAWEAWVTMIPQEMKTNAQFLRRVKEGLRREHHIDIREGVPGIGPPQSTGAPIGRPSGIPGVEVPPTEWGEVREKDSESHHEVLDVDGILDTLAELDRTKRTRGLSEDEQELYTDMAKRLKKAMEGGIQ